MKWYEREDVNAVAFLIAFALILFGLAIWGTPRYPA